MNTLIVFVTDAGFLVPSLVAAQQLVRRGAHALADIVIYTVNVDAALMQTLEGHPANRHIRFESLPYALFAPPPGISFHKNHVPVTSLARLSLQQVIAPHYANIVYIDGDVQIVGDVAPLIRYRVPDGKILAGRGSAWLDEPGSADNVTPDDYLQGLGGVSPDEYFNAGVLAFRLDTWRTAAPAALQFFFDHSTACVRHDQSALNAIFRGNIVNFSPRYNFHSAYYGLHLHKQYAPSIIHFTGPRKPWGLPAAPWGDRFTHSYVRLVREQPSLEGLLKIQRDRGPGALLRKWQSWRDEAARLRAQGDTVKQRRDKFMAYVRDGAFPV